MNSNCHPGSTCFSLVVPQPQPHSHPPPLISLVTAAQVEQKVWEEKQNFKDLYLLTNNKHLRSYCCCKTILGMQGGILLGLTIVPSLIILMFTTTEIRATYSSMSSKFESITIQCNSVLPRQVTANFIPACSTFQPKHLYNSCCYNDIYKKLSHIKQNTQPGTIKIPKCNEKLKIYCIPFICILWMKIEYEYQISSLKDYNL